MIIRDNVYGDIEIPSKFVKLINTNEFQRLRRIKQLATADQVFPGATHSRFSHSIGTYHVMKMVITHFEEILKSIGQEGCIDVEEKDIILAAALLHDIGHGPFSHAFEKARISAKTNSHEIWTEKIITDESTGIYKELEKWGKGTARRVADYINYRTEVKKRGEESDYIGMAEKPDFRFIFTSLVSSQLDADRMDYLLRDSMHCGVTFGKFDLDNLIVGMEIGIDGEGKFRVCIKKSYLSNVEEYFCARYQMYRNIYLHPYKVMSETLLEKILNKACKYYLEGMLSTKYIPTLVREIFDHADISLKDYLKLDDTVVVGAIHMWAQIDEVESEEFNEKSGINDLINLCKCFLYRNGYKQILLTDVDEFLNALDNYFIKEKISNWEYIKDLLFIKCSSYTKMYDKSSEKPVYILTCNGRVQNLADVSGLLGESKKEITLYYNQGFSKEYLSDIGAAEVERLLYEYDIRRAIEIEKKYIVENHEDFYSEIIEVLKQKGYTIHEKEIKEQIDYYYDTNDRVFYRNDYTLRIREWGNRYFLTLKTPSNSVSNGEGGQLERNEIEREIGSSNITDNQEFTDSYLRTFFAENGTAFHELYNNINIINKRKKVIVIKNSGHEYVKEEKYEIVFDDVKYINAKTNESYNEQQVEIELKSAVETRINMKGLTNDLERKIPNMQSISESKYHRAVDRVLNSAT